MKPHQKNLKDTSYPLYKLVNLKVKNVKVDLKNFKSLQDAIAKCLADKNNV